jgi:hypothetical protein
MRSPIARSRLTRLLTITAVVALATIGLSGSAFAGHAPAGTTLWGYEAGTSARILQYDVGTDTSVSSCVPSPSGNGRGLAFDPVDGNLWYTFVDSSFDGDGFIHKTTPGCGPVLGGTILFGDGPGGLIQDDVGALDIDPDDGNIWAAGYNPIGTNSVLYKVNRLTGAILASCTVPFGGGGVGNDTLTEAKLSGLPGSGSYLLTDAGEITTTPNVLLAVDEASCVGGGPGLVVTTFSKARGMSGIDYELNRLFATNLTTIFSVGNQPFSSVVASMSASPSSSLEDITLKVTGQPTTLTLSPKAATNEVDSQHCVTATVRDQFGNPSVGVVVIFSVTGSVNTGGSVTTNSSGQAQFCYTGPPLPGADAIHAFADTNNSGRQDPGEPFDDATKAWVLPVSTPLCEIKVNNGGWFIADNDDRVSFGGMAKSDADGNASGNEEFQDHGPAMPFNLHGDPTVVVCPNDQTKATIFGTATIDGTGSHTFRIDVTDNGEPGRNDLYRMRVNAYDSGEHQLKGGNVLIHRG